MPLGASEQQRTLAAEWVIIMTADRVSHGRFTLLPSEAARMVAARFPGVAPVDVLVALAATAQVKEPMSATFRRMDNLGHSN